MRLLISVCSITAAVALIADQHKGKVMQGGDGWWDWHSRDPDGASLAKATVWSHDAWAFGLGVLVPGAMAISSLGSRR